MLNYIWIAFFVVGFTVALIKTLFIPSQSGLMTEMLNGIFGSAKTGFEISMGLTGMIAAIVLGYKFFH